MITGFTCPNCSSQALTYVDHGHGVVCAVCRHKLTYGEVFDMEWPGGDPLAENEASQQHDNDYQVLVQLAPVPLMEQPEPGGLTAAQVLELVSYISQHGPQSIPINDLYALGEADACKWILGKIHSFFRVDATPKRE